MKQPTGNDRMRQISAAVQEGAQAYLKRQYTTIAMVGVVLYLVIGVPSGPWHDNRDWFCHRRHPVGACRLHRHERFSPRQRAYRRSHRLAARGHPVGGQRGQPVDLVEGVEHDVTDPGVDGQLQLDQRLVVAVQGDPLGREPGGQGQRPARCRCRRPGAGRPRRSTGPPARRGTPWTRSARRRPRTRSRSPRPGRGSRPRPGRTAACRARGRGR